MYYVYEYIRLDNNTTFYVGKGKGNRAFKTIQRREHFENIINKTASFIWKRDKNRIPYNPPNNFKKKHSHIKGLIFEIATK